MLMKLITPYPRKLYFRCFVFFILLVTLPFSLHAQSVPIYATTISSQDNVDFSSFSNDSNLTTRARVRASSGIALGIGAYDGHIELKFPQLLPANTTSYIKIQTDDNLLSPLLGGSLAGLLSNVLGTVLAGNQEFTVQVKNGSTQVLLGNSQTISDFSTDRLRIVIDANNDYFIAITPAQQYDRIRLTNRIGSLLGLNNTRGLYVYDAFYIGTPDICGGASYTSFEGSGLNLDLLGLGGAGVTNPNNVLDSNPDNFSKLSLGILSVAASIEQTVYYEGLSQPTDQFFVRLKVDPSLLALGVANNIQIEASRGTTVLQTVNLQSLLNLDLLTLIQAEQAVTVPFKPNMAVDRITVRYNSLLNVQLTQSLNLYSVSRAPADPVITDPFTLSPKICSGSTASLSAQTGTGTELRWYSQAAGGAVLATTASGVSFVTDPLTQNTSFYVSAKRINCPEESPRIRINVIVVTTPTASDITIPNTLQACNGSVMLSPSSSIGGATFRYYKDQNKTQEIVTGFAGDAGVTYTKNAVSGELSISGLTALNSPYIYYVSLTVDGLCENVASTLKQVTVNYSSALALTVLSSIQGCGSVNLRNAIVNFNGSSDVQYNFFDSADNAITADAAAHISSSGIYSIQATSLSGSCSSTEQQVTVTVTPLPVLTITNNNLVANTGSLITLQATSNSSITWYDSAGNALASNIAGPFATPGFYTFTAISSNLTCSVSGIVSVTVIDPAACPVLTERAYANSQSWSSIITGNVSNPALAADGNPRTFSTITTGIGLLGIGTTSQSFQWNQTIAAGTPVTLKLGSEYSALIVAGAYAVIGTKRNSSGIPVDIGALQPVSGSLLNLLSGENTFEYSFVPTNMTGPKAYDGIRIVVGSVASLAQSVKVYEAYYEREVAQLACSPDDVEDVFSGSVDLGVGVATTTVGVENPFNAVDMDVNTYATMYSGVGILAAADLTVSFRTPTLTTDSVALILSTPSNNLDINVLSGLSIQLFLGSTAVSAPIQSTSSLLSLYVSNVPTEARLVIAPFSQRYDRIKIRLGGVAAVLNVLRVNDIRRIANTSVIGGDSTNSVEVCQNDVITLTVPADDCLTYIWYDAAVGGNIVSTGTTFTVPWTLVAGTYTYHIQPVRFGCPSFARGPITFVVKQNAPPTAINQVTINGNAATTVCNESGTVTLTATLNSTLTITNPVFYWYYFDGTTTQLVAGQNTATLALANLAAGTYTYYVGISSNEYCQTDASDRTEVNFTILPFSQPTDITADNVLVCVGNNAVVTPTSTQPNPRFFWFFSNNNSQPIANGTVVNGITYAIAANGALTVSGLTVANSPYTYYVGLTADTRCLNQSGNFKAVTITVNDSGTPTTNDITQDFCLSNVPTISDIQINEPNVNFYDAPSAGNLLPDTAALVNGQTYYAGFDSSTGCASFTRLAVTVAVTDAPTPTTNDTTQDFCLSSNPTIGSIQVNEPGITFYSAPTGSTALSLTSALVQGATYYASLTAAVSGCESSVRLAITVNLNDVPTPSTNATTQNFCFLANSTVANIQVNEPNVIFYTQPTGGTVIAPSTPLVGGNYYASLTDSNNCESSTRLVITVTITNPATPTTNNTTQNFCLSSNPTVADLQVNETNVSFYTTATGGMPLATTATLIAGTYYAGLTDVNGCESSIRLAIAVTVTDPAAPTATDTTPAFCIAANATIADLQVNGTGVIFYTAATAGTELLTTAALVNGTTYYAAQVIDGCESTLRLAITVSINAVATPTTNDNTQEFCFSNNPTIANIQVNEAGVVFFTTATGGTSLAATQPLVNGTVYYASLDGAIGCESTTRLAITVTVTDPATPTTNDATQDFCFSSNPTVGNIQVNEGGVSFYTAATGGTPIAATTALVAGTYYAGLTDANGCESSVRLVVTVTVTDPAVPTTNDSTPEFCIAANATIADIQVNETGVVFYTTPTAGTALASTTALINGTTYYAAQVINGCEGSVRLAITVTITEVATPTSNDNTQEFCLVNNPTIANIQVNEPGVVFYATATGGTALAATQALINGTVYYASLNGAIGCESITRLAITVTVTDPATPTTNDATQNFCIANNPTIANIQVNEAGVVFYTTATGGTAVAITVPLITGTYYGAIITANGCESSVRLAISVMVNNPAAPTTNDTTQDFCQNNNPVLSNLQVNESNIAFYAAATGGTALLPSTALVNGTTYYVSLIDGIGCESSVRLAITVTIGVSATPTTNDTTQDFCLIDNPTIGSLQVNETGVVFYNAATAGTVLSPATALVNGATYYASFGTATNCPSPLRLAITVTVNNAATPTTNNIAQDFCASNNPTVANLQTNQSNVLFYTTATAGTALAPSTPLVTGTYYGSLVDPVSGCPSAVRLVISVEVLDTETPVINGGPQTACVFQEITYTTLPGKSNYFWTVTNGTIVSGGQGTDEFVTVQFMEVGQGTVNVSYSDNCSPDNNASYVQNISSCSDITISKTVNNPTPIIDDEVIFTITVNNVGIGQFLDVNVVDLLPSGYAFVSATTSIGSYSSLSGIWLIPSLGLNQSATLNVTVKVLATGDYMNMAAITMSTPLDSDLSNNFSTRAVEPQCLIVYNEFTPNGDGSNDTFRIDCIENYPNNKLEVYNRYGVLVFSKKNYNNDWDGTSNASGTINKDDKLPTGTYYYILTMGMDSMTKKGWVYIVR